jgi:prepilin-type N-terminal cleavage/methylation domain-containing protein
MGNRHRARHPDEGFTLVELSFVLLLIAILALLAIASFRGTSSRAAEATCLSNQRTLSTAMTVFRGDHDGDDAASFDDLKPYARDVDKTRYCPLDGTDLVMDTATDQVSCPNHPS